ncbi:hypothetical protein Tco_1107560 [Tanacetum coccineum]
MIKKDPASSSAPKTSLAANARRNNEKALNILLSAIPDRHLLSFHDATNCKNLMDNNKKARFGGNEGHLKKMPKKNLLNQQFEDFYYGSLREKGLIQHYERSLPSVWHVVAFNDLRDKTWIGWQLEFDDLYNNLRGEKRIVAIEVSNSKACSNRTNNDDIDWDQGIDAETSDIAMMALTELEEDDWSMEIDAEPSTLDKMGTWCVDEQHSDDTQLSLALMSSNQRISNELGVIRRFGVEYSSSEENNNSSGDETLVDPLYENFKREKAYKAFTCHPRYNYSTRCKCLLYWDR